MPRKIVLNRSFAPAGAVVVIRGVMQRVQPSQEIEVPDNVTDEMVTEELGPNVFDPEHTPEGIAKRAAAEAKAEADRLAKEASDKAKADADKAEAERVAKEKADAAKAAEDKGAKK